VTTRVVDAPPERVYKAWTKPKQLAVVPTRTRLIEAGLSERAGIRMVEPLGYVEFISLVSGARIVLTDSGGLQEESTFLGVPCLTLRENTERPVTISHGTNRLVGSRPRDLAALVFATATGPAAPVGAPPLWDGRAAERIVAVLRTALLPVEQIPRLAAPSRTI